MLPNSEGVQTLIDLGLTSRQARVYLALAKFGVSTAKKLSEVSGVTREDVYKVLHSLVELGFVEKTITQPANFGAVPLKTVTSTLLKRRSVKTKILQEKSEELIKNFKKSETKKTLWDTQNQFILLPMRESVIQKRVSLLKTSKNSIDAITTWKRFCAVYVDKTITKQLEKALKRGVKVRVVTELPQKEEQHPEIMHIFDQFPTFELRHMPKSPTAIISLHDQEEVLITISQKTGVKEAAVLWSNNPNLLALINDYFEVTWITSIKATENLE